MQKMAIPRDAWCVVLEFVPSVGVWAGLALRAVSCGTHAAALGALWSTGAGRVFLARVLRRCAALRAPVPNWITEAKLAPTVGGRPVWARDAERALRAALRAGHVDSALWLARAHPDRRELQARTDALADAVVAGVLGATDMCAAIDALRVDERRLAYDAAAAAPSHEAAVDALLLLSRARPSAARLCERALEARLGRHPELSGRGEARAAAVSALRRDCAPMLLAALSALHPDMLGHDTGPRCARAVMDWAYGQPNAARAASLRRLVEAGGGRHWPARSVAHLPPHQALSWLRFARADYRGPHRHPDARAACHPSEAVQGALRRSYAQLESADLEFVLRFSARMGAPPPKAALEELRRRGRPRSLGPASGQTEETILESAVQSGCVRAVALAVSNARLQPSLREWRRQLVRRHWRSMSARAQDEMLHLLQAE